MNKIIYKLTLALLAAVLLPSTVWADDVLFLFGNGVNLYSQSASTSGYTELTTAPDGRQAIKLKNSASSWKYIGFSSAVNLSSYSYLHFDVYHDNVQNTRYKTRLNVNGSGSNTDESDKNKNSGTGFYWYPQKWTHVTLLLDNYKTTGGNVYSRSEISSIGILVGAGQQNVNAYITNIYASKSQSVIVDDGHYTDWATGSLSGMQDIKVSGEYTASIGEELNSGSFASIDLTEFYSITPWEATPISTYTCEPTLSNCLVYVSANETFGLTKNVIQNGTCGNLQLTDDTQHAFSAPTAFTATAAQLKRTFSAAGIYSFVAPFDVTDIPAGITARQFVGIGGGKVTFAKIDALTANQPYLIEVEPSGEYTFEASSVSVPVTTPGESAAVDGYVFTAVMTPTADGEITGSYVLDADGSGFVKAKATTRVGSMRAYLKAPDASEARLSILFDDDNTTGISKTQETTASQHVYYNLNGQRVEKPTKGLYIQNSRKVVIK